YTVEESNKVEWAYAFDVHTNAFFPLYLSLYLAQLFLAPVITKDNWVCLWVGNSLYLASLAQYTYITYLGFNALPFLVRSELLLFPLLPLFVGYLISLLGFNVSKHLTYKQLAEMAQPSKGLPPPSDDDPASQQFENGDADPSKAAVAISESDTSEGGKLKMIVQLVKRCLGVKDIAAIINDSSDPLERMLAVLRYTFSKDLKFIRGKICKPYNSVLGEHFRAHWTVAEVQYPDGFPAEPPLITTHLHHPHGVPVIEAEEDDAPPPSSKASVKSSTSNKKQKRKPSNHDPNGATTPGPAHGSDFLSVSMADKKMAASAEDVSRLGEGLAELKVEVEGELDDPDEFQDAEDGGDDDEGVRVVFLTEQISHHPPASSYYFACPEKGVEAAGVDQISAKVSGT
ncbi:hypothetical protein FRC00_012861, partial [Tulasnella sp. 408]